MFRVGDLERAETVPALAVALPAGASGWTPPGDRCLAPGRYAWSVRAVGVDAAQRWSEALLFQVRDLPTEAEVRTALEILQRHLGIDLAGLGLRSAPTASPLALAQANLPPTQTDSDESELGDGGPAIAVRGEVPDLTGETYGVRGVSNSPEGAGVRADNNNASGPDLVLGGSPPAEVTEAAFSRDSPSPLTFDFTNPGPGTMTLRVNGADVLTTAADDWVNETGDAMTGLLSINVPSGFALQTSAGDSIDVGGDFFKSGGRILHTSGGAGNLGVGPGALAAVTTGFSNTAVGASALDVNTTGLENVALGRNALGANTTGGGNTALGTDALAASTTAYVNTALGNAALSFNTGTGNTAVGAGALFYNGAAGNNTAVGTSALVFNISGSGNVAVGTNALDSNTSGSGNVAIGDSAGSFHTVGSNNIAIGSAGVGGESNTIRVGGGPQTRAFIGGIRGTTTGVANAIPVLIDGLGQLGTVSSSARFKEDIADLGEASERLLTLRPVQFRYRPEVQAGERPIEYGLIAEEVAEVFPELVVYDAEGRPETVKYHVLSTLLLNELQEERRTNEEQQELIGDLLARLAVVEGAAAKRDARGVRSSECSLSVRSSKPFARCSSGSGPARPISSAPTLGARPTPTATSTS